MSEPNCLSHTFFCWQILVVINKWKKKEIHYHFLERKSQQLKAKLEKVWNKEQASANHPSLTRALFKAFGTQFMLRGLLYLPFNIFPASEIDQILNTSYVSTILIIFRQYLIRSSAYLYILIAILSERFYLTPQNLFAVIMLYNNLKFSGDLFVSALLNLATLRVSIKRIEEFLLYDYIKIKSLANVKLKEPANDKKPSTYVSYSEKKIVGIFCEKTTIKWISTSPECVLLDVNFSARCNDLVAITGVVGSGKSTLIHTILKETVIQSGTVVVEGSISYASQEPCIFPGTIKKNILLGEEMDHEKYTKVIKVCALERDLSEFCLGDETFVGERGVTLSGGQQARINLARAVYKNADIYLLDDCLSSVDTQVGNHIFQECILGYLKNKCVIFVTHQTQYLQNVDKVYLVENKKLVKCDTGDGDYFSNSATPATKEIFEKTISLSTETQQNDESRNHTTNRYKRYFSKNSIFFTCTLIFFIVLNQIFLTGFDYILKTVAKINTSTYLNQLDVLYLLSGLSVGAILISCILVFLFVSYCINASRKFHEDLVQRLLAGSMHFFNNFLSGRVLHRLTEDISYIDQIIPVTLFTVETQISQVLGSVVLIIILDQWLLIPTTVLCILIYVCTKKVQPIINDFRRLEAISKGPILTHLVASVNGLSTIKATNSEKFFELEFHECLERNGSLFYVFKGLYQALSAWADMMCTVYFLTVMMYIFYYRSDFQIEIAGLIIVQANMFLNLIQYLLKLFSDIDSQMISVERVADYENIVTELDDGNLVPGDRWPNKGEIIFESVTMKYAPDKNPSLKNINLHIQSGEKIGIIGRTGSGKTSLICCLLRLYDFEGKILIDGVDSKSVQLKLLRSKISSITQKPILFLGTLRQNLDPFNEFSDSQLWNALENVKMKEVVVQLNDGLDTVITEDGANFSVGQKQLLCLARIFLRDSKIIVLDEATANVDLDTDGFIRKTVMEKFARCTILIIAHRLNNIEDCDKILVMDSGHIVAFDRGQCIKNRQQLFA